MLTEKEAAEIRSSEDYATLTRLRETLAIHAQKHDPQNSLSEYDKTVNMLKAINKEASLHIKPEILELFCKDYGEVAINVNDGPGFYTIGILK